MKLESANPRKNALVAGVTDSAVVAAIARSGYPLQGVVAAKLASGGFYVQEEWSYLDRDTKNLRNIDIVASRMLHEHDQLSNLRVRPQIDLIVECKKSELPYVFFSTRQSSWLADFPVIAGLRAKSISLRNR